MPLTSYMLATAQHSHKGFCFVVSPSPGSRSLNTVSHQHVSEIEEFLFVTELHMLVKFRFGKLVVFHVDGSIVFDQPREVQEHLESSSTIVAQSALNQGLKFVAIDNKRSMVVLKWERGSGVAEVVSRYSYELLKVHNQIRVETLLD